MPEYMVPANLWFGQSASESPGVGVAIGDSVDAGIGGGIDYIPDPQPTLGGLNHYSLSFYASDTTGDTAQEQPAALSAALDYARQAGGGVVIDRAGTKVTLVDCGAAFATAAGNFYVDPSDIGIGTGQIPPDNATLTAAALAGHPHVFVRNPNRVRLLTSQQGDGDLKALTTAPPQNPAQVYSVDPAPDGSRWVVGLDGAIFLLDLEHPAGSNLRRPQDVWNSLLVSLIELPQPVKMQRRLGTLAPFTFGQRGEISQLNYLDYARYVEPIYLDGRVLQPLYEAPP